MTGALVRFLYQPPDCPLAITKNQGPEEATLGAGLDLSFEDPSIPVGLGSHHRLCPYLQSDPFASPPQ